MKSISILEYSTQIGRIEHLQLFELFKHASETLFNLTLDGMQILVICEFFKSDDN